MQVGEFRASCRRMIEDAAERVRRERAGKSLFCDMEFLDFASFEKHCHEAHPEGTRKAKRHMRGTWQPIRPTRVPLGRPAVALDKQAVPPGTEFTYEGVRCQVIGAAGPNRTLFTGWFPEGKGPSSDRSAQRVPGDADPETGLIMWQLTAPTDAVVKAVQESEAEQ